METTIELLEEAAPPAPPPEPIPAKSEESADIVRIQLCWSPRWIAMLLGSAALVLVLCHLISVVWHYELHKLPWAFRGLFDLDEEQSFGTWFSSGLLSLAGIAAMLCAVRARATSQRLQYHWWGLGFGFVLLSIDEIAGIHESINSVTEISWAIPGGILAGLVGLVFLPFLFRIPRAMALLCVIAGVLYLGGAVGVEYATEGYLDRDELNTLEYNLTTAIEEWLEMIGVVLFLYATTAHLARDGRLKLSIDVAKSTP